jgi:hypothetical protein
VGSAEGEEARELACRLLRLLQLNLLLMLLLLLLLMLQPLCLPACRRRDWDRE